MPVLYFIGRAFSGSNEKRRHALDFVQVNDCDKTNISPINIKLLPHSVSMHVLFFFLRPPLSGWTWFSVCESCCPSCLPKQIEGRR